MLETSEARNIWVGKVPTMSLQSCFHIPFGPDPAGCMVRSNELAACKKDVSRSAAVNVDSSGHREVMKSRKYQGG